VNSDPRVAEVIVTRVEIAARGLLALSTRASMMLPGGISLTQLRALAAAENVGPCTMSALAGVLMISSSSASRMVDRLASFGALDRRASEISRREVTLEITAHGRRLLRRHEAARRAVFAGVLQNMTDTDVRALIRGLEAVARQVGESAAAAGRES
jgi:DNA-binding MarR family transcriptional regulator